MAYRLAHRVVVSVFPSYIRVEHHCLGVLFSLFFIYLLTGNCFSVERLSINFFAQDCLIHTIHRV